VGSELLVAKAYVQSLKQLRALAMWPVKVELSERYAWHIVTNTGLKIELGRDQDNMSVQQKLDRLVHVYPKIIGTVMPHLQSVDLRYPQAVAVKGDRTLVPHLAKMGHGA
jgi:cell division protein FtsQ